MHQTQRRVALYADTLSGCMIVKPTGIAALSPVLHALAGFMSNRGRQNVASYLILDCGVDWRQGADYFESILTDYDICSNWGNWLSAAGLTVSTGVADLSHVHNIDAVSAHHVQQLVCNLYENAYSDSREVTEHWSG